MADMIKSKSTADLSSEEFDRISEYWNQAKDREKLEPIEEDENPSEAFIEMDLGGYSMESYDEWQEKEKKVMDELGHYNIEKVIKKINRRKKWNNFLCYIYIPFRFDLSALENIHQSYLQEYFLRLNNLYESDSLDPICYDLYRGMKPEEFSLSLDTYKEEYQKVLDEKKCADKRKRMSWLVQIFFKKRFAFKK